MQGKVVERVMGTQVRAKLDKCKVSPNAFKEVDFYLMSGEGVDNVRTVLELGVKTSVVSKKGSWFSWTGSEGEIRGQGLNAFRDMLTESHISQIFSQVKPFLADPNKAKKEDAPSLEELASLAGGDDDDYDDLLGDI